MKLRIGALAATISAAALALTGCGSTALPSTSAAPVASTSASTANLAPITADEALFKMLPQRVQDSKKIIIGVDATYKPNEYLDTDGKTVIGMDVELFDAVAARMGVTTEWQSSAFDQILIGLDARKYDAGVSSFTINEDRKKSVNFVQYLNAGTLWVTPKGNPKQIDPKNVCGQTIAVQTGTVQHDEMKAANDKCAPDQKINLINFGDQGEVTNAVASGRAGAMLADSPIAAYAVKMSNGQLEGLGDIYDAAPYGYAVHKQDTDFAAAIAQASKDIKDAGYYDAILAKYGQEQSAVTEFTVNP